MVSLCDLLHRVNPRKETSVVEDRGRRFFVAVNGADTIGFEGEGTMACAGGSELGAIRIGCSDVGDLVGLVESLRNAVEVAFGRDLEPADDYALG